MNSLAHSTLPVKLGIFAAGVTALLLLSSAFRSPPSSRVPLGSFTQGTVIHIVLFEFTPTTTASAKEEVASAFLALEDACRRPDGSKYIISVDGGLNHSPENATQGLEHGYVVAFSSTKDRDYYVYQDPAHQAFKASLGNKVEDVVVFDFDSGDFARSALNGRVRPALVHKGRRSEDLRVRMV